MLVISVLFFCYHFFLGTNENKHYVYCARIVYFFHNHNHYKSFHSHQYFHYIPQPIYQLLFAAFTTFLIYIFFNIAITRIPNKSFITYPLCQSILDHHPTFVFVPSLFIYLCSIVVYNYKITITYI